MRLARAPELVQVAGQAAGGAEHSIARRGQGIDQADHLALAQQRLVLEVVDAVHLGIPSLIVSRDPRAIVVSDRVAAQFQRQLLQRDAGIAHKRQGAVLVSVKLGHIDIDEADACAGEGGLGSAGEIAVAGADADDQVGLARQQIGALGAGHADGAQVARIVVSQRALARLRLADRECLYDQRSVPARHAPRCNARRRQR